MNKITVCFSPTMLAQYEHKDSVVVVTDVFRATTTMGVKRLSLSIQKMRQKTIKIKGILLEQRKKLSDVYLQILGIALLNTMQKK